MGTHRRDQLSLRRHPHLGPPPSHRPFELLHRKLLPELDPRVLRHPRYRIPLRRLLHPGRSPPSATRIDRPSLAALEQQNLRPPGHQPHRPLHGAPLSHELSQLQRKLRPPLPRPRKDDRMDSAELPQRLPHDSLRLASRRLIQQQSKPTKRPELPTAHLAGWSLIRLRDGGTRVLSPTPTKSYTSHEVTAPRAVGPSGRT